MSTLNFSAFFRATRFVVPASLALLIAVPGFADEFGLGVAAESAVVSVGPNASIMMNSGPVTTTGNPPFGDLLVGQGSTATFSGGGNGALPDGLFTDGTVNLSTSNQLQTPPSIFTVASSVTASAFASANSVASNAASLTATQTFGNINGATTITGNGGLNVIDVANINNAPLTISGTSSDKFIFNISGTYQTNVAMTLHGVTSSQLLFNFTGTSGNVFQTSGGDTSYGTYLATDGGNFQFSNLHLTGNLINTDGHIQYVSGTRSNYPFVPEPASVVGLLGLAAMGLIGLVRNRRRAA